MTALEGVARFIEVVKDHCPPDLDLRRVTDLLDLSFLNFEDEVAEVPAEEALKKVAHAAWHLLDDGGEADSADDNGVVDFLGSGLDTKRLSDALDELEATGWDAHPDEAV